MGHPHWCASCGGTGRDERKTRKAGLTDGSYIRCWDCNGGGLDPAEYFRWGPHDPLPSVGGGETKGGPARDAGEKGT